MSSAQIDTLETLLQRPGGPPLPELKIALGRLSSELRERVIKGSSASYQFFASAVAAISRLKGNAFADLRLECLYESGCFFYRNGFARAALETGDVMEGLARRTANKLWMVKAATFVGVIQGEAGNVADAVTKHAMALRLAREIDGSEHEARVLINLGTAFNYSALYNDAISCFRRVVEICANTELRRFVETAYCDLAQAYLAQEQFTAGFECITRCLQLGNEPSDAREAFNRTIREFTYVQLAIELGKMARAREHAALCRRYSRWGENTRSRTLADIANGLCEVHGGDVEAGLLTLQRALDASGDFFVSRVDVLSALVKAYDELGQADRALYYLSELLSFVRAARSESLTAIINTPGEILHRSATLSSDVQRLELREAQLRAQIAEHELFNSRLELLERLAIAADVKEESSGAHGYRVGKLSALVSHRLGWSKDSVSAIEVAARLHDIGKIGLPDRILLASDTLRESDFQFVAAHTQIGAEMLAKSRIAQVQIAEEIARHHHEWWDGTGYPAKLSGKRIPIHARIVALADVFDALTHGRPYAPAWPVERALEEIRQRRGTQFDPDLTDVFLALIDDLQREHPDLDGYLGEASRNSPFLQARDKIRLMLEGARQAENMAAVAAETVH